MNVALTGWPVAKRDRCTGWLKGAQVNGSRYMEGYLTNDILSRATLQDTVCLSSLRRMVIVAAHIPQLRARVELYGRGWETRGLLEHRTRIRGG